LEQRAEAREGKSKSGNDGGKSGNGGKGKIRAKKKTSYKFNLFFTVIY
jgi:hypothetical protein